MKSVEEIGLLSQELKNQIDIVFVYIEEIHAADGWHFQTNKFKINQHRTIEERFAAGALLKEDPQFKFQLVVDTMQNEANFAYGAVPERIAIVYNSQIKYIGGIGPYDFNVEEANQYLLKILKDVS